ncbi:MAG: hypothetical protein RIM84_15515 [Alphaproteobacteria bacterium]
MTKLKVGLIIIFLTLPANAVAGSSVSAMPAKPQTHNLPDCKKHEKNVDDCHIPDKDTFLHLRKTELPAGWHAKAEYKERERRSKKSNR